MKTEKAYGFFAALRMTVLAALALAALSLGSCVEIQGPDDDVWNDLSGDVPIRFTTTIAAPATKTGTALPNGTHFGVFAYYTGTSNWGTGYKPNFMFDEEVVYSSGNYTYSPIKYWPNNTGEKVTFWAYSPYDPDYIPSTFTNNSKGTPNLEFSVTDGQTDLLISGLVNNKNKNLQKQSLSQAVEFTFHHTLSKIDFTVCKTGATAGDYTVTLTSIRLTNIYDSGVLKYTHNLTGSTNPTTWDVSTSHRNNLNVFTGSQVAQTTESGVVASVMVIPQEVGGTNARLRIDYTIAWTGSGTPKPNAYYVEIPGSWLMNRHYTYKIRITPDLPIEFTVTDVQWSSWGDANNYDLTS